jgi:Flp pilus assembly secretin CpaC
MRAFALTAVMFAFAALADDTHISLVIGGQKVVKVAQLQRVAVGDSGIADITTIGNDQILVKGTGRGRTEVHVWRQSGAEVTFVVTVRPP